MPVAYFSGRLDMCACECFGGQLGCGHLENRWHDFCCVAHGSVSACLPDCLIGWRRFAAFFLVLEEFLPCLYPHPLLPP